MMPSATDEEKRIHSRQPHVHPMGLDCLVFATLKGITFLTTVLL